MPCNSESDFKKKYTYLLARYDGSNIAEVLTLMSSVACSHLVHADDEDKSSERREQLQQKSMGMPDKTL